MRRVVVALFSAFALMLDPSTARAATSATAVLSVAKGGSGSGTVTSDIGLIDCGGVCSDSYADGTMVTLTATPALGSQFIGWLGACAADGPCVVTVNGPVSVSATFAPVSYGIPSFDADDSSSWNATTDGLLILRYLLGVTGNDLTGNAVEPGAGRSSASAIAGYLDDIRPILDVDGNGQADARWHRAARRGRLMTTTTKRTSGRGERGIELSRDARRAARIATARPCTATTPTTETPKAANLSCN